MKRLLAICCLSLAACATAPSQQQSPVTLQTASQVANAFCVSANGLITDLQALSDLTAADQADISKAAGIVQPACKSLQASANPDLNTINMTITQGVLQVISASNLPNKDKWEIAIIGAQALVTTYLTQLALNPTGA